MKVKHNRPSIYWIIRLAVFVLVQPAFALVSPMAAKEIGPEANLCAEINKLEPGETLVLKPGDYRGPCRVRRGGFPGLPTVIEGEDLIDKPRIVYDGQARNVFEIEGDHVTLRGLKIGPTKRNIDGVRIFARAGVTVEDCEFAHLGGIAIAATRTSIIDLTVRRNIVTDSAATALYFGCHDGAGCQISNLIVERNFIRGVDAPEPEIGYGIQVKLNSTGVIRDNVVADTKGPGIMAYGSKDPSLMSVVERNFVTGSRTSSGILLGGGPALVRNNIVSSNFEGGITFQDYANRGLLRKITVANNTSFKNGGGEFVVPSSAKLFEVLLTQNAAVATEGVRAFPQSRSGLGLRENVDCSATDCFVDPVAWNFSPRLSSPLSLEGHEDNAVLPKDDYFGRSRKKSAIAGAIGSPAPAINFGIKS